MGAEKHSLAESFGWKLFDDSAVDMIRLGISSLRYFGGAFRSTNAGQTGKVALFLLGCSNGVSGCDDIVSFAGCGKSRIGVHWL